MAYKIDLLNAITAQLGGTTVHRYNINALNEWCTLAGGSGGHKYDIDAYNELATIYTGSGGFKFDIKAMNAIVSELGGTAKTYTVDVLSQLGALLNQNDPPENALKFEGTEEYIFFEGDETEQYITFETIE